jgi:acetyl-CoA C-acetyltransferase
MADAVIVSAARTPLCKSWRGALNNTHGAKMGGHVVHAALERARVAPEEVSDVIMGCANPEGATGWNIARQIAIRAGCPLSVPGMTVNRFCSSGLQSIALASQRILAGEEGIYVAGGLESISLVQNEMNKHHFQDEWLHRHKPETYWPMLQTAEYVARRYEIPREKQDEYGVQSQRRAAKAREAGKFKDEIVPITTKMKLVDKETGRESLREVTVTEDEGIRPDTTYEGVSQIKPAIEGGCIAAGNASQFSDGAGATVVMSEREAAQRGLQPLGIYRGFAVAGCDPKEMGIGPVFAVPKLLHQTGKKIDDIDLWELNEAFAVQVLYCRDRLGIDPAKAVVDVAEVGNTSAASIPIALDEANRAGAIREGNIALFDAFGGGLTWASALARW